MSDWSFHVYNQTTRNDHPQYQLAAGNPTTLVTSLTAGADLTVTGGDGAGHGALTVALSEDTAWTNASSFTNGWSAGGAGAVPRFIKLGKVVFLNGLVTGGTNGLAAFTLPAGYRPSQNQRFGNSANAVAGVLLITPAGAVAPFTGSTTNVSIDCSFTVV